MEEIPILGVVVGWGQVQIENEKVKAIKEWKTLTKIKEVESFLEFANFYVIYEEFQSYSEISQQTQRKEGMELDRRTSKSVWRA